jgi:hypothetical protein
MATFDDTETAENKEKDDPPVVMLANARGSETVELDDWATLPADSENCWANDVE